MSSLKICELDASVEKEWGQAVLWIRIRGIRMFLGLPDPDPSLFCMDPDPLINKQKSKKNLDFL